MKDYNNSELRSILHDMKSGTVYCAIDGYNRGIGQIRADDNYIRYSHFGSSAVSSTIRDLKWLVENIFTNCQSIVPAEWSDYHINYIPVNRAYKGIDYSTRHPNTFMA